MHHLDAREVVGRGEDKFDVAVGVALGAGEAEAVDGDGHVVGGDAVDRERPRIPCDVADGDSREILQHLADIAIDHGAEFIGRHDVPDVRGETLLVDRDGRGVHLPRSPDDKVVEFNRGVGGGRSWRRAHQFKVLAHDLPGHDGDAFRLYGKTGEEGFYVGRTGGHARQAIRAVGFGQRPERSIRDGDAGFFQIFRPGGLENAALDRARGGGWHRGGGRGRERKDGEPRGGGGVESKGQFHFLGTGWLQPASWWYVMGWAVRSPCGLREKLLFLGPDHGFCAVVTRSVRPSDTAVMVPWTHVAYTVEPDASNAVLVSS
jgi:hypothetical protein